MSAKIAAATHVAVKNRAKLRPGKLKIHEKLSTTRFVKRYFRLDLLVVEG
jgi:hypothetical protein